MDDRLVEARLYAEKMLRDRSPDVTVCGADLLQILGSDDDEPLEPLLNAVFRGLRVRGWHSEDGLWVDPEGNKYAHVEGAITAQSFREIADISEVIRSEHERDRREP